NWLRGRSINDPLIYTAPRYSKVVADEELLGLVRSHRPLHVVVGIGAGPQEKLGYWLREHLDYRPAIHCIGGALGVMTGDQKPIPDWADRLYLGWLLRLAANPAVFLPRLWRAHQLPALLIRYGRDLPPHAK
ncbi:MAG: WecB/TagA/CpsF family glycosyltransferase, partial [Verrucomicrobiota bacterium]|nr:WecB/TagA/CpsF family glycosyltransferase [Verrucomicrobiota bacterium]